MLHQINVFFVFFVFFNFWCSWWFWKLFWKNIYISIARLQNFIEFETTGFQTKDCVHSDDWNEFIFKILRFILWLLPNSNNRIKSCRLCTGCFYPWWQGTTYYTESFKKTGAKNLKTSTSLVSWAWGVQKFL